MVARSSHPIAQTLICVISSCGSVQFQIKCACHKVVIQVQICLEKTVKQNLNNFTCCAQIYHACELQYILDMQHLFQKYRFYALCERVNIL